MPDEDWLAAHAAAHLRHGGGDEIAVVGYTGWHPRVRSTPLLALLNQN